MAFDQNITYRVNVDDTNFQAKLTQMRASMDASMGGGSAGGFSSNMMYGMMGVMGGGGGGGGLGGGVADFGSQIRPVTYTPPAIAMQPHFGMFQVQQSLSQAGLGSMGPVGIGVSGAMTNFRNGGVSGLINGPGAVPNNVSMAEYMAMSARGFGDRMGDAAAIGAVTAGSTMAGLAAGGAGSAMGASLFASGFGKAIGGLAGGMVGGAVVSAYVGQITDMMADSRQVQNALASGSFRFFNGGSGEVDPLTGRGMSRRTRANVAGAIQGMELNDQRYGMDEYKQILEGGMQMDLFSGTRDSEDFKGKFKGLVEALKTVSATMHTSLKEGLEVMRGMRDMGVTDPSEVTRLALGSEMRGRMAGRTGMEMMGIGQAGAEIFRGTGVSMEKGFELNQMNAVSVRGMLNSGGISRDSVGQAGGELALAQQMTASSLQSMQTGMGRAALMANFNPSTGQLNPNIIGNMAGRDLQGQIANAAAMGPAALMNFQAHQEDIISQMSPQQMQMIGVASSMGGARMLMGATGASFDTAFRVFEQNQGKSKAVIDADLGLLKQDPEKMMQDQKAAVDQIRVQAGMEDFRNRFNIGKRISNSWRGAVVEPVSRAATEVSTEVGEIVDNAALAMSGGARIDRGMVNADSIADAGRAHTGGVMDVTGNYAQRHWGQSGQGLIDKASADGSGHRFKDAAAAQAYAAEHGDMMIGRDHAGNTIGVSVAEAQSMSNKAKNWQSTQADTDSAGKAELSDKIGGRLMGVDLSADAMVHITGGVSNGDMEMADGAFEKKYKHSKGYYSALAGRYADTYNVSSATKSALKKKSSSGEVADALAAGAADASNQAKSAAEELMRHNLAGLAFTDRKAANYLSSHAGMVASLFKAGSSPEELAKLNRMSGMDMTGAVSYANAHRDSKTDERVARASQGISMSASTQEAGGMAAGSSAVMGDLSKDTSAIIEKQSAQLISNYNQLIELQKQLNRLQKGGS